jgi:hypothetical protein
MAKAVGSIERSCLVVGSYLLVAGLPDRRLPPLINFRPPVKVGRGVRYALTMWRQTGHEILPVREPRSPVPFQVPTRLDSAS